MTREIFIGQPLDDYNNIHIICLEVSTELTEDYPGPSAAINSPVTSAKEGSPIINSVSTADLTQD